jgi:hypothetical protein
MRKFKWLVTALLCVSLFLAGCGDLSKLLPIKDFLPEKDAVVDLASQMLANYLESAGEDADTKTALAKKEAELDALAQRKQRNMNFLLDGTLDAVMFKQNEAQISADIEAAQLVIRRQIAKLYGESVAMDIPVLYGGSVNKDTAPGYLDIAGIDGLLIGGASLIADSFCAIVESAKGKYNER